MDRYIRLVDGLDAESVGTVNRLLTRIQIMEHCRKLPLDIYTGEEKRMLAFLEKDFPREVLKLSDNCYVYQQYRLPVYHFEPCVFLDKHGITQISNHRDRIIQGDIIDTKGFIGDSVLVLSPYTNGKIYTFEPVKKNFDLLQRTIELNHITNAVCEKAALGSHGGTAAFAVQGSCSCRADSKVGETEKVPVITLDEYVREYHLQVGLIKSDLEDMDWDFLLSAKETIVAQKPVLLLSMYHNDQDFFGLKPLLESWNVGYRFKVFKGLDYGICLETMLIAEVLRRRITIDMKVVLLAGGFGTRISEESQFKPKPMVELGGMPILWHIMKLYGHHGFNEFIICAGYKQHVIKEYFADYFLHTSDITYDFTHGKNEMIVHRNTAEPWKVTVVDTGLNTMTGGRVKRVRDYVGNEPFMLTYGDGVSDLDITALVQFHQSHGKLVTISAYNAGQRFGVLDVGSDGKVLEFREKTQGDGSLINIGFMVCQPEFFDYIEGDTAVLEKSPLETVAKLGQLMAYKHKGFWQCMDTVREKDALERLWANGQAPWKVW